MVEVSAKSLYIVAWLATLLNLDLSSIPREPAIPIVLTVPLVLATASTTSAVIVATELLTSDCVGSVVLNSSSFLFFCQYKSLSLYIICASFVRDVTAAPIPTPKLSVSIKEPTILLAVVLL